MPTPSPMSEPKSGANVAMEMPVAEQRRRRGRDADREERDAQGQQHGEERAEGEEEDDRREDQSVLEVRRALLRGELLEGVPGELDVERRGTRRDAGVLDRLDLRGS